MAFEDDEPITGGSIPEVGIDSWKTLRSVIPYAVPLIFYAVFLGLVMVLTINGRSAIDQSGIITFALIFAAIAILQAAALLYASSDGLVVLAVVGGFLLFSGVALLAIVGPFGASLILLAIFALLMFSMRGLTYTVHEKKVAVTTLFGRYYRTLIPGFYILMPGEAIEKELPIDERIYSCPSQKILVSYGVDIELVASVTYRIRPEEARLAALEVGNWEESLQHMVKNTVYEVVNELTMGDFTTLPPKVVTPSQREMVRWEEHEKAILAGEQPGWPSEAIADRPPTLRPSQPVEPSVRQPDGFTEVTPAIESEAVRKTRLDKINDKLLVRMQHHANEWGIEIKEVKISNITLPPSSKEAMHKLSRAQSDGYVEELKAIGRKFARIQDAAAAKEEIVMRAEGEREALQGIIEMYNAIQDGRIRETMTIWRYFQSLEQMSQDPGTKIVLPFNSLDMTTKPNQHFGDTIAENEATPGENNR